MTIYDKLIKEVTSGKSFTVNLKTKTLKVGKEVMIDNGNYDGELIGDLPKDPWEMVEELFFRFYESKPSERSGHKNSYFAAKSAHDMDEFEIAAGEPRLIAQAKLEGFVLCAVLAGLLKWNPLYGNWFWQSQRYTKLVLLKEWF